MSSVYNTVVTALRKGAIIDTGEAPTAQQMDDAIGALNRMCTRWEADGQAIGWVNVVNPSDTLPCPPENEDAVIYNLCTRLCSEYGMIPPPDVTALAVNELAALSRDRIMEMPLRLGSNAPRGSGWYGGSVWDTISGNLP